MTPVPQFTATLGLSTDEVRGRSLLELYAAEDIRLLLAWKLKKVAAAKGVHATVLELELFDDPDLLAAADMSHRCPSCVAGRDQVIAGLRDGRWAAVATGLVIGTREATP